MIFYVLVEPFAVYVNSAEDFIARGGLVPGSWGRRWHAVEAETLEAAKVIGEEKRANKAWTAEGKGTH